MSHVDQIVIPDAPKDLDAPFALMGRLQSEFGRLACAAERIRAAEIFELFLASAAGNLQRY